MQEQKKQRVNKILQDLERDGYAVVENVITPEDCQQLAGEFEETMKQIIPDLNLNDTSTYKQNKLPPNQHNLLQHYNIGFWKHAVHLRSKVKHVFADVWGTDDLWTSFDATSFSTKNTTGRLIRDLKHWEEVGMEHDAFHLDETRDLSLLPHSSIQSGISLFDQQEDGHVFACIPGGHHHYEDLIGFRTRELDAKMLEERAKADEGRKRPMMASTIAKRRQEDIRMKHGMNRYDNENWWILSSEAKKYLTEHNLKPKRVPLRAGSMVLWVSHLPHTSTHYCMTAADDARRLQVFVSMFPRELVTDVPGQMEIRRKAYETGRVSKHSADFIRLFGKKPRTYSKAQQDKADAIPEIASFADMTEEEKKLHGLI